MVLFFWNFKYFYVADFRDMLYIHVYTTISGNKNKIHDKSNAGHTQYRIFGFWFVLAVPYTLYLASDGYCMIGVLYIEVEKEEAQTQESGGKFRVQVS